MIARFHVRRYVLARRPQMYRRGTERDRSKSHPTERRAVVMLGRFSK